jgi:hypothetical protein
VQNVQAAIDAGETILLKAVDMSGVPTAFEFGTTGGTVLTTDGILIGETIDGAKTRIHGGLALFGGSFRPVRSAIRGIHFDGPRLVAGSSQPMWIEDENGILRCHL